ncbi:LysR family transcriptional regulator [Afifella pfennigii]|uniref:LysR family transcriptional regulator n=1 Tax=Afifella pfennigii TaxID=209897 RepID=UPI00146F96A2|nr:LysR family transcriptional regulator [Afifella pfennigii]
MNRSPLEDGRLLSGDYWDELRVFLAVAKAGSYSRASEFLSISQPTVSRRVKRLQDVMHAQLVVSSPSGVRLTPKGALLAERLATLDQTLFSLSSDLSSEARKLQGLVRVSITEGLGIFFLVPLLRQLLAEHPLIQVDVQSPLNVNDLRQNQTDMMVSFAPVFTEEVTCRELGVLHLLPVVSRDYVARMGLPTRKNLAEHLFIQSRLYQADAPTWKEWNAVVARGRIAHLCDNSFMYGMMVKAGLGIGLLGNYTMLEPTALPLDLGVHVPIRTYACAMTERLESKPARLVFERVCEALGKSNPWFTEEMSVTPLPSIADDGVRIMFNLPAVAAGLPDAGG